MEATNYVIVKLDNAYDNEKYLGDGGQSIIVNSTIESVEHINREATVLSAPNYTILKKGDKIIAHHNIFRKKRNYKGVLTESDYQIEESVYYIPLSEIFLYKPFSHKSWKAVDPYIFIEPITLDESSNFLLGIKKSYKGREHKIGKVTYLNKELEGKGLSVGDKVAFKKNSEYEFNIDGRLTYRMKTKDILLKLNI